MPQVRVANRIWPAAGSGSGLWATTSSPPRSATALTSFSPHSCGHGQGSGDLNQRGPGIAQLAKAVDVLVAAHSAPVDGAETGAGGIVTIARRAHGPTSTPPPGVQSTLSNLVSQV